MAGKLGRDVQNGNGIVRSSFNLSITHSISFFKKIQITLV